MVSATLPFAPVLVTVPSCPSPAALEPPASLPSRWFTPCNLPESAHCDSGANHTATWPAHPVLLAARGWGAGRARGSGCTPAPALALSHVAPHVRAERQDPAASGCPRSISAVRQSSPSHPPLGTWHWVPQWQQVAGKGLKTHYRYHPMGALNAGADAGPHPRCLPKPQRLAMQGDSLWQSSLHAVLGAGMTRVGDPSPYTVPGKESASPKGQAACLDSPSVSVWHHPRHLSSAGRDAQPRGRLEATGPHAGSRLSSPFFHSSPFWGDGGLQSPHICRQRAQTAHLGVPCAPYLLPIEGSCTLSAPWIGCSVSQHIHFPGCLEMLQQGWPGHPPKHPISPWPDPTYTRESWEHGRMWSSRLGWVSRALTVGRDELGPPGQVKVAAWVTSVTGNWRGDRGGQLQAALWRSSRAWGGRVRGSWVSKAGRQEPWLGPGSARRAALCSAPSNKQAEGPPPRERGLLEVSGAAIRAFPRLSCYLSFSASPS